MSQCKFSLIILGGDLGIVDTWHATINFKIMICHVKKFLQKFTLKCFFPGWGRLGWGDSSIPRVSYSL